MAKYNFERFDKRSNRYVKTPELTIQASGGISMNAAAHRALGEPEAVELLYDADKHVMGLRGVEPARPYAYPLRRAGKKGTGSLTTAAKAFFQYYDLPLGTPVRREVTVEDGVLIVNLNDPGRLAISNRNRSRVKASGADGDSDKGDPARTEAQRGRIRRPVRDVDP